MPIITLPITVTSEQATKIQAWFTRWNADLPTPYDNIEDALIALVEHNLANFIKSQEPFDIKEKWDALTDEQREQIKAIANAEAPV